MKNWLLSLVLAAPFATHADMLSAYTSVETTSCVTYDSTDLSNGEIDYYTGECPGLGGYQVFVSGGDLRYSLQLKYEGQSFPLEELTAFHDLGSSQIEWRYERSNAEVKYTALIYRLSFQEIDQETGETSNSSKLVVVRLAGADTCVLGTVAASSNMNEKARELADNSEATCRND